MTGNKKKEVRNTWKDVNRVLTVYGVVAFY